MTTISSLRRRRGQIQGAITSFVKILDDWQEDEENRDPDYLVISLETVQKAFSKFSDLQDEIEELDETECSKREPMQTSFNKALARARKYLRETDLPADQSRRSVRSSSPIRSQSTAVKLPAITLPKFDGSSEGWTSFFDIFSSLIDKNEDLSPVRKLHYLRLSLSDNAARTIQSLETTDANYEVALSILKKKYECTRRLLCRHWAILREYPRLQKDSPAALSQLVDTVHQHVRALENLGAPVENWDIPLIDLILTKINSNTAWHWELTLTGNKMPSYTSLLSFLEKRANCVEFSTTSDTPASSKSSTQRAEKSRPNKNGQTSAQAFNTTKAESATTTKKTHNASCAYCTGSHTIHQCETSRALSIEQRQSAITKLSLCSNCLGRRHNVDECHSERNCRMCKQRHHSLLHDNRQGTQTAGGPPPSTSAVSSEEAGQQA